jgi:hypothetical protein
MDKAALLDAIAKSGSAGRTAYEQAQQNMAAQQAEAIRGALASGVAGQAGAGAQAQLAEIAGQPYQSRMASLQQNQTAMEDWYNRLGAARGSWADQQNALQQVALQQALAQASGGGGGGGGGGGSTDNWADLLREQYGTLDIAKQSLLGEAERAGATDWKTTGLSPIEGARKYAVDTYGMPPSTAEAFIPTSEFEQTYGTAPYSTRKIARKNIYTMMQQSKRPEARGQYTGYTIKKYKQNVQGQYGPKFVKKASRAARQKIRGANQP